MMQWRKSFFQVKNQQILLLELKTIWLLSIRRRPKIAKIALINYQLIKNLKKNYFIKKETSKVYKEISSAVKEWYITLKEVEKQADNHIIRKNVYKQATSEIDEDLIME